MLSSRSSTSMLTPEAINSVTGVQWQLREVDERVLGHYLQQYAFPEIVARLLLQRGISVTEAMDYLNPSLRYYMPDPFHLKDMHEAVARTVKALQQDELIAILGDYDVDGATSSALLKNVFCELGYTSTYVYIPDRIAEGYGPSVPIMEHLAAKGVRLVITVDCGTLAFEPLQIAKKLGMDVIVLDHHLSDTSLPEALAIVNPNRVDETSSLRYLAAVGVSFLFAVGVVQKYCPTAALQTDLKQKLLEQLSIVALGTVCDVVPLLGLNRAFVVQGLKLLNKRLNLGLTTLADIAGINEMATAYHLGFILGPRINAGGRVGESYLGTQLLSTKNKEVAVHIAQQLHYYNQERKAIETLVLDEAMQQAALIPEEAPLLLVYGENWHPGVIGIVAGRLKEKYNKPVAVVAFSEGIGKASARSIKGIDFGAAVINAKHAGLLIAGGGHAMAAGFTITKEKLSEFQAFLANEFAETYQILQGKSERHFDGYLTLNGLTVELAKEVAKLGPFGTDAPEPRFILTDCYPFKVMRIGGEGISCLLANDKIQTNSSTVRAVAFRCHGSPLEHALLNQTFHRIHVVGKIRLNCWQGKERIEFLMEDIIPVL